MAWLGALDRIAAALEGCQGQLTRIADHLGAPATVVEIRDPEGLIPPLTRVADHDQPDVSYRDPDLLLQAQDAEETLTLLLGRPPSIEELARVLSLNTES